MIYRMDDIESDLIKVGRGRNVPLRRRRLIARETVLDRTVL